MHVYKSHYIGQLSLPSLRGR